MIASEHEGPAGPRLERDAGRAVFGADVPGYEQGRLGYPPALYDFVLDPAAGKDATIVEIGPGTGLATVELLAGGPARLLAVEPDPALARYLRHRFAGSAVDVVESDFMSAPITGPIDLVASAASFHWLEPESALARIHRLLRPGGRVALWWNVYRQSGVGDPLAEAIIPLLDGISLPPSEGRGGHYALDAALHRAALERAGFVYETERVFRRERTLTAAEAVTLYASYSFIRALPGERRVPLLDSIADLVEREFGGRASNVVLTPLYTARMPG
jgi:SAM-dependent methyltransferase